MKGLILALGYFDSLHIGHRFLLNEAKNLAKKLNGDPAILTYETSLYTALGKKFKQIYTYNEHLDLLHDLEIENYIKINPDKNFINLSPKDFFESLIKNNNILGLVCGTDFRFGKNASGDINLLQELCNEYNIELKVVNLINLYGQKVSSTNIRDLIKDGKINEANTLLNKPFMIKGRVIKGFEIGRTLGYPTANISFDKDKLLPNLGVYATITEVDGVIYDSITNVGNRPTFNSNEISIETFIFNYESDIYGKTIKIYFVEKIRDIVKFNNKNDLIQQINKDILIAKSIKRGTT